jgi:hypothetical protein
VRHAPLDGPRPRFKLWEQRAQNPSDRGIVETAWGEFPSLDEKGDLSATRLLHLTQPLLTYVRSNQSAIVDYGARFRSGRRIASALAESAVNSLVARRMVKKQQMLWSKRGAHLLLQVRAAVLNGDLRERLATAEASPSIADRVDVRTYTTPAQSGVTTQLI